MSVVYQVWTIPKENIRLAFIGTKTGISYRYTRYENKPMLVYVAPDTYWKIVECLD